MTTPQRGYYGWTMLGVSTVAFLCTAPGQTVAVSQFNTPIRDALGLSSAELSTAYMIATLAAALPLTLVGKLSDRIGPRAVMGLAAILLAATCGLMGLVGSFTTLIFGFVGLRLFGQGSLSLASAHALALWFHRSLGTVESVRLAIFLLANAAVPAATIALIGALGWRVAYPVLGLVVAAVMIPLTLFLARDRPEHVGQTLDGHLVREAIAPDAGAGDPTDEHDAGAHRSTHDPAFTLAQSLRTRAFYVVVGAFIIPPTVGTAVLFHSQPIAATLGLTDQQAATAQIPFWIAQCAAILVAGRLADRYHPAPLLSVGLALIAGACLLLAEAAGMGGLLTAMGLLGAASAVITATANPTIARWFGRAHHGAIRGAITTSLVAGTAVGPVALGVFMDAWSFRPGMRAWALVCLPLAAVALLLRRPNPPNRDGHDTGNP